MKYFPHIIITIVAITVIGGFFVVGSPTEQRLIRFDAQKVADLQSLQGQIIFYWQSKERLPENISELRNEISGFIPPRDPETGNEYEYAKKNANTFELCATFNRVTPETPVEAVTRPVEPSKNDVWWHKEGRVCFTRTVDKELYPPFSTQGNTPVKIPR